MEGTANLLGVDDPLAAAARFVCESLDFAPGGFAIVRLDGTCVTVNGTLAGWVQPALPAHALQGRSLITGEGDPLVGALRRARIGEAVVIDTEHVALLAHRPGPWRLHVMPFRVGGVVRAASVSFEDRSEQRRAAAAFEASERRFRRIVEAASDGIAVQRGGVLLYANAAAARILGYSTGDELVGMVLRGLVHADSVAAIERNLEASPDSTTGESSERTFLRRDGTPVEVDVSVSRSRDDPGPVSFLFFRDVSDRKRLEAELERSNRMESLGRLAGGAAHDFNNLLGGVQASLGLARLRAAGSPSVLEAITAAEAATRRASQVTRELLTFSRGDAAAAAVVDVPATVREAVQLLGGMEGKRISLDVDLAPEAATAWVGSSQLLQIVLNLLLNARDAVGVDGRIRVSTRVETLDDPDRRGPWLVLGVDDDGVGMDEATRARVFEPFFTTKAPGEGTGLGLSTVYGVVKQVGGFIAVDAEPGQGAHFRVYLPRAAHEAAPSAGAGPREEPPAAACGVLVCEDDARLAMLIGRLLEQMGFDAATVGKVDAAVEALEKEPDRFNVVLLDVNLPPGTARDVLARMKSSGLTTPVILTSGYAEEDVPSDLIADPQVTTYLPKPYAVEELAHRIEGLLEHQPKRV